MFIWVKLIVPSILVGLLCGWLIRGLWGVILGAAVPWFGLLAVLIYGEYFAPPAEYKGGGASMWPIAQLFAGTVMTVVGGVVAAVTQIAREKYRAK